MQSCSSSSSNNLEHELYTITFIIDEDLRKEQLKKLLKKSATGGYSSSLTHNETQIKLQVDPKITIWNLKIQYYNYIEETEGLDPLNISFFLFPEKEELQVRI